MLMLPTIPSHFAGHQTAYLLHNSEYFFPPLNAICSLLNIICTGITFYSSRGSGPAAAIASAKLPRLAVAALLNVATTAWALTIMVPMNKKMTVLAGEMEKEIKEEGKGESSKFKGNESELRRLQKRWQKLNVGRAMIMVGSALAGFSALLVRA